jgi:FAD:protein FMN transferase
MPSPSPDIEPRKQIRRARALLGTIVDIEVSAMQSGPRLHRAIDQAFAAVERVQALMSYHDADSELSRLNRSAHARAQPVHPDTYRVLESALAIARLSDGAFDPCVAPQMEQLGYLPRCEFPVDVTATWRDIELIEGSFVRYRKPLRLDLGGIAKGYAVDIAVEMLQGFEIDDMVVNAGGDLRVAGSAAHSIGLRHPEAPAHIGHCLMLQNEALATSAPYYSAATSAGQPVSALIDGRNHAPLSKNCSISVCADHCMTADALTKVALFADPDAVDRCLARFGAKVFVLQADATKAD